MATFYGEVLPVISRAVDDDEEDDEYVSLKSDPVLHWSSKVRHEMSHQSTGKLRCDVLVVAIGPAATGFTDTCIKHSDYHMVGCILTGLQKLDNQTLSQRWPTDKTCYIYRSNENTSTFLCLCNLEVAVEQCYSWTNQVLIHARSQQYSCLFQTSQGLEAQEACIVVMNTFHYRNFTSRDPASDLPHTIMRCLKTSRFVATPLCPGLEQPNLITGLAAQLMTYCQAHDIKAVLYQCYTNAKRLVDFSTVKAFLPLLQSVPLQEIIKRDDNTEQRLRDTVQLHELQDTLYI